MTSGYLAGKYSLRTRWPNRGPSLLSGHPCRRARPSSRCPRARARAACARRHRRPLADCRPRSSRAAHRRQAQTRGARAPSGRPPRWRPRLTRIAARSQKTGAVASLPLRHRGRLQRQSPLPSGTAVGRTEPKRTEAQAQTLAPVIQPGRLRCRPHANHRWPSRMGSSATAGRRCLPYPDWQRQHRQPSHLLLPLPQTD